MHNTQCIGSKADGYSQLGGSHVVQNRILTKRTVHGILSLYHNCDSITIYDYDEKITCSFLLASKLSFELEAGARYVVVRSYSRASSFGRSGFATEDP